MVSVDMGSWIPESRLPRKIDWMVSVDFRYELLASYYPVTGCPSDGPVRIFKTLMPGYLYGIKSERRLAEKVRLNIADR